MVADPGFPARVRCARWFRPSCRRRRIRRRLGWTLIEVLLVVAIIGTLAAMITPRIQDNINRAKIAKAIGDIRVIQGELDAQDTLPATLAGIGRDGYLDAWGRPYQYLNFGTVRGRGGARGAARKDRFLVPINSTYDLYSMGKDGRSQAPLTTRPSRDDIVRANDGAYIGLASRY